MITKVISGYQTGTSGWIPRGRGAQDGRISQEDVNKY